MRITILTDNPNSWVMPYIEELKTKLSEHEVKHILNSNDILEGDLMLILSCERILRKKHLDLHKSNIVVHPSKLPHGKGWSPLAWQILEGEDFIPMSLFEASEEVDAGNVYLVKNIELNGTELNEEIKDKQGALMIEMILEYVSKFGFINGIPQIGEESFYKKRTKADNRINIDKSIKEQFNLLRIVDNERYPAHFELNGCSYILKIYKES
jgi:methionyl-tRNA formyltransferase